MSREKQIEEMASDFCALDMPCEECHLYKNRCHAKKYATRAYNAGYRKSEDVAREIFEDIFYHTYYSHGRLIIEHSTLLALQKKYTESEKDNG